VLRARVFENRAWLASFTKSAGDREDFLAAARSAANEALERNEQSAGAYEARGRAHYVGWLLLAPRPSEAGAMISAAESDLLRSLALDPNRARAESTLSLLYESQGRFDDSRRAAYRALEADAYLEDAEQIVVRLFFTSFEMGNDEDAGRWCDETRRRMPGTWVAGYCDLVLLGWRTDVTPDPRKALYILETFGSAEAPEQREAIRPRLEILAATTLARAGEIERAEQMVQAARAAASRDVELLHLEAAYRIARQEYERANQLLEEYMAKAPLARPRVENSRMFRPLRAALGPRATAFNSN
jgi:tetratricopeptide (TPR) repeat protein